MTDSDANQRIHDGDLDPDATYIIVDRTADGDYFPAVIVGERTWRLADPAAYASTIMEATETACHDAAVIRLMIDRLRVPREYATWFVAELRKDRPAIDQAAALPLEFRPLVSETPPHLPWLALWMDGKQIGQWTPAQARVHAAYALCLPIATELDRQLAAGLRTGFELGVDGAGHFVHDVMLHREDDHDGRTVGSPERVARDGTGNLWQHYGDVGWVQLRVARKDEVPAVATLGDLPQPVRLMRAAKQ